MRLDNLISKNNSASPVSGVSFFFYTSTVSSYAKKIRAILTPAEIRLFERLHSPTAIQNFLEGIPSNFELHGETNCSPRSVLKNNSAHCFEGAVLAAAILAYHGEKPLLMDFATAYDDEDHCVALFKKNGLWGAISKTNHAVLLYRDPVYNSPRELAMSYFHEYYMRDGRKSLRAYSAPFDLSKFDPKKWITTEDSLDWIHDKIAAGRYYDIAPERALRNLRKATPLELESLKLTKWKDPRKKRIG